MNEQVDLSAEELLTLLGIKTAQQFAANRRAAKLDGQLKQAAKGNAIIDAEVTRLRAVCDRHGVDWHPGAAQPATESKPAPAVEPEVPVGKSITSL